MKISDDILKSRRELFCKKYEEAFGIKLDMELYAFDNYDDYINRKLDSGDYVLNLNYYGIKSNWL